MTFAEVLTLVEILIAPKHLKKAQKLVFEYCWKGLSYYEIAQATDYDLGYIKEIGSKLWQILSEATGEKVNKKNLRTVLEYYSRGKRVPKLKNSQQNWGNITSTEIFYGRESELDILIQWSVKDRAHLIGVMGMAGIGKTTLVAKLVQEIRREFDYMFWHSLKDPDLPREFLKTIISFLSDENKEIPRTQNEQILELQNCLASARCLVILDNFDSLFQVKESSGKYKKKYQKYEEILLNIGQSSHQSCVIITSRVTPNEIAFLQGESRSIKEIRLQGLEEKASRELLSIKGIKSSRENLATIIKFYQGNPLSLSIVASSIQRIFGGNVAAFIEEGVFILGGIHQLLKNQIGKLSQIEQQVMYCLAINNEPVPISKLQMDIYPSITVSTLLEILESLRLRSLIERTKDGFSQQPIVMQYMSEELVKQIVLDLESKSYSFLNSYNLIGGSSQINRIIKPLVTNIVESFPNLELLQANCQIIVQQLSSHDGYAISNLVNLSSYLPIDLKKLGIDS